MRLQLLALSALCVSTLAAHADDYFSLTGNGQTFTFTLPASPTPSGVDDGPYFSSVAIDHNGTVENTVVLFYNSSYSGGLQIGSNPGGDLQVVENGPQLYTGSDDAPTFTLGEFELTNYPSNQTYPGNYLLDITSAAPITATPEPSSFILLGSGILGVAGAIRRKLA